MRNKIRNLLIWLANKIGTDDYYDFGEPITGVITFGKDLLVYTKHSIYGTRNRKKWIKLKIKK